MKGWGTKLVEQLVDAGLVRSLVDLYDLQQKRDQLLQLERQGEKSIDKLLAGIENSKGNPVWRLLTGLNIRHVGVSNAQILVKRFGSLTAIQQASEEELAAVDEIGEVIATSSLRVFPF